MGVWGFTWSNELRRLAVAEACGVDAKETIATWTYPCLKRTLISVCTFKADQTSHIFANTLMDLKETLEVH